MQVGNFSDSCNEEKPRSRDALHDPSLVTLGIGGELDGGCELFVRDLLIDLLTSPLDHQVSGFLPPGTCRLARCNQEDFKIFLAAIKKI